MQTAGQTEILDRFIDLVHTCVPPEQMNDAFIPAVACIVGGAALMLWGAKTIRALVVLSSVVGGGYAGYLIAQRLQESEAVGVLVGAALIGMTGFVLARIWIAGLSGILAGTLALTVYGYHEGLFSRFEQFVHSQGRPAPTAQNEFPLAEAGTAKAIASQDVFQMLWAFQEHLREVDDPAVRNGVISFAVAGLAGLLLGLVAYRWAMILWTSAVGVLLVLGGGVVVLSTVMPKWRDLAVQNVTTLGIVIALAWVTGIFVQWRATRPRRIPVPVPVDTAASLS